MPLVRISVLKGKSRDYRRKVGNAVHRALVETIGVPEKDRFQIITDHWPDEFVYDPGGKSNSTIVSLTRGTFVFVAGQVAKTGDMRIETPVATMGVRGTTPHVEVSDDGTTKFSTLIEESKNKHAKKSGAAGAPQPEQRAEHRLNLNICRGC